MPEIIRNLPLADSNTSKILHNIQAPDFDGDETYTATLRAFLWSRINFEADKVEVKLEIGDGLKCKKISSTEFLNGGYLSLFGEKYGALNILTCRSKKDISLLEERLFKNVPNLPTLWLNPVISQYLSQKGCKTSVFIHDDRKQTFIVAEKMNIRHWHYTLSALPVLLPWYFNETPITSEEREILHALERNEMRQYVSLMERYCRSIDINEFVYRKILDGFSLSYEREQLDKFRDSHKSYKKRFKELQKDISDCIWQLNQIETEILGLEIKIEKGDMNSLLTKYFLKNKTLVPLSVKGNSLNYLVKTYIEYFDQKTFLKFYENLNSKAYYNVESFSGTLEDYKRLVYAIFGPKRSIRIRTCAEYQLITHCVIEGIKNSENVRHCEDRMPNFHINNSACLGGNEVVIHQALLDGNYIEAIEQTVAATMNINLHDANANTMFKYICTSEVAFLELPTGDVVTTLEAVAWLKGREKDAAAIKKSP